MKIAQIYISLATIAGKEVRRFMRIWTQTLLPPAITISLYYVIFGNVMGKLINKFSDYSYIEYIAPGLVMMAIIMHSYNNVVSSFFGNKFQRSLEEILVSPTPNIIILLGFMLGGVVRGVLVGIIAIIVTLFFTTIHIYSIWLIVSIVILSTVLFSLVGFINAIYAKKFDDIAIIPSFVLTPMIYLGGIFYSIDLLSDFWRSVSLFNPILYIINSFRYAMLGIADINVFMSMAVLCGMVCILFAVCLFLLHKGVGIRS